MDSLYQLGIETIGQLQQLPRNDLAMRFGNCIHQRLDQLSGKLEETFVVRRKPTEFVAEQLLEYPTHHRETIEVIIARLVTKLCSQMRSRQRGALEWTIKLACQTGPPIEFRVNLFQPTATTAEVMPLVEMQLEQALSPHTRKFRKRWRRKTAGLKTKPGTSSQTINSTDLVVDEATSPCAPTGKTGLVASSTTTKPEFETTSRQELKSPKSSEKDNQDAYPTDQFHRYTTIQVQEISISVTSDVLLVQKQRQLFDENPRLDRQSLAHLINRLASRLGNQNVVYPVLQSGAQPEYAYRLRPLVDPSRKHRRRRTKPRKASHVSGRPLRLFHPARPLERCDRVATESEVVSRTNANWIPVVGAKPKNPPGSPALLRLRSDTSKTGQRVIRSWGPERIETGWWRGLSVCRDYWRVETERRQHFWVYRDLRSGQWFLHGEF